MRKISTIATAIPVPMGLRALMASINLLASVLGVLLANGAKFCKARASQIRVCMEQFVAILKDKDTSTVSVRVVSKGLDVK